MQFQARGIPSKDMAQAYRMTIPGAGEDVARYREANTKRLQAAILGTSTAINRYAQNASSSPYNNLLTQKYYDGGLGDSDWFDVAKTFVGQIGGGIAAKIGGHAPPPTTIIQQAPAGMSTGAKVAIGAAIGLPVLYLLFRRKR